jgi:organic hydroperoxide reductase OsmC/OhrA
MSKEHHYQLTVNWQSETGTQSYNSYTRDHTINVEQKAAIEASSDPDFRGNKNKHNPEELLLASIASCHMLWYLHFCAVNSVVVTDYKDEASGVMEVSNNGSGRFISVTLKPRVTISEEAMLSKAKELHKEANKFCFIANSLNFEVYHQPEIKVGE